MVKKGPVLALFAVVAQMVLAQGPPNGGGEGGTPPGGGGATDANPYNMANWKTDLPVLGTHKHEGYGWYKNELGVVKKNPGDYSIVPPPEGDTMMALISNSSGEDVDCFSKQTANVTVRWEWIGQGPAPSKVWVRKEARAQAAGGPGQQISLSNGLGSPVVNEEDLTANGPGKRCSGSKMEEVSLQGNLLSVEFSVSAEVTSWGTTAPFANSCHSYVGYSISLKAVQLSDAFGQTFKKGGSLLNPQRIPSPPGEKHTIGRDVFASLGIGGTQLAGYGLDATFGRSLIGQWGENPYNLWTIGDLTFGDTFFQEFESATAQWRFPLSAIDRMAAGNPEIRKVKVQVNETNGIEDSTPFKDQFEVYIHTSHVNSKLKAMAINSRTYLSPSDFSIDSQTGYAFGGSGVPCHWNETKSLWDVFDLVAATSESFHPLVKTVIALCELIEEDLRPKPINQSSPWAWGEGFPMSTYNGSLVVPPKPADWSVWRMRPRVETIYEEGIYECERWDQSGYIGQQVDHGKVATGFYRWSGQFESQGQTGVGNNES